MKYSIKLPRLVIAAITSFQSSDITRPRLNGVCVEVVRTLDSSATVILTATDGFQLASYTVERAPFEIVDGEFRVSERSVFVFNFESALGLSPIILDGAEDAADTPLTLVVNTTGAYVEVMNLERGGSYTQAMNNATYPDWRAKVPYIKEPMPTLWCFDFDRLAKFVHAGRTICGSSIITVSTTEPNHAYVVRIRDCAFVGVLMPCIPPEWMTAPLKDPAPVSAV